LVYAYAQHDAVEEKLQEWLQTDGIDLVSIQLESQLVTSFLAEKVKHCKYFPAVYLLCRTNL
jgi:hypothetical protein